MKNIDVQFDWFEVGSIIGIASFLTVIIYSVTQL